MTSTPNAIAKSTIGGMSAEIGTAMRGKYTLEISAALATVLSEQRCDRAGDEQPDRHAGQGKQRVRRLAGLDTSATRPRNTAKIAVRASGCRIAQSMPTAVWR